MAAPTVVATAEPDNVPPRVKIVVTDTGTPAVSSVTVVRRDPDGSTVPVRTLDGNPLILSTVGSNRVGTIYDPEPPLGITVTYSTLENPASSSTAEVDSDLVWLVHPGVPSRSLTIDCRPASFQSTGRSVNRGVFRPLGRKSAVVVTDGRRKSAETQLVFRTETLSQLDAVVNLVDDAQTLMLNVPPSYGWGITKAYIAVGDIDEDRPSDIGSYALRDWTFPYTVVDRPAGGSQAQWNYAGLLTSYASYAEAKAAFSSYAAVQANTPTGV